MTTNTKSDNKKPVADLEGDELDYWVARADEFPGIVKHPNGLWYCHSKDLREYGELPMFSRRWSDGGPIIERGKIAIAKIYVPFDGPIKDNLSWVALNIDETIRMDAETPLVAAMRCFVASKLGLYVEVVEI